MSIKKSLNIAMAQKGISQKELAKISGVAESTISLIMSGKRSPNISTLGKLAAALDISYPQLINLGE